MSSYGVEHTPDGMFVINVDEERLYLRPNMAMNLAIMLARCARGNGVAWPSVNQWGDDPWEQATVEALQRELAERDGTAAAIEAAKEAALDEIERARIATESIRRGLEDLEHAVRREADR